MRIVKWYSLWLQNKQGDELADHAEDQKPHAALRDWASSLRARADLCDKIALALEGVPVRIDAQGMFIFLIPESRAAETRLSKLAKAGLIMVDRERIPDHGGANG